MKLLKIFLCAAILASSVNGVYAADSTVTDALKQVKERIDTSEYTDFKSSYYQNDGEGIVYSFNWEKGETSGLNVNFQDGIITGYYKYDYNNDEGKAFSLEEAEALQIAEEFVEKINPDIYKDIKIRPLNEQSIQSDWYNLDIYREKDGVPVLNETGYMEISKKTKEVTDFYINYTLGVDFKPLSNIISETDAKAAYKKLITPKLRYNFKRDYNKKTVTPYLEYIPKDSSSAINAYTGEIYDLAFGQDVFYNRSMGVEEAAKDSEFTPAEIEETERIAGLLSEDDAKEIAAKNEFIAVPKDLPCTYISLRRNWYDKNDYTYELAFSGDEQYISVSLDAKSGEILNFYNYSDKDNELGQNRKTEEEKAQKAFGALAGEKAAEFRLLQDEDTGMVRYIRTVDGLDVCGDEAYFYFDGSDGLTEYYLRYTKNVTFPEQNGVISPEEAAEKAFSQIGFELSYAISGDRKTAQPIYCIGKDAEAESFTMNPFSGNLTDYNGDEVKEEEKIVYSDIENHYGKNAFLALANYGIGFYEKELKPDQPITQAEYFTLLNKAFGYDADIDEIYSRMIRWGGLSSEEREDNAVLTREKAAIFMIREMGAEEFAKYEEIFVAPFDDVTENKGYIAILKAKKIVNGDGSGNFYPKNTVTRGEALIMLYNYFVN